MVIMAKKKKNLQNCNVLWLFQPFNKKISHFSFLFLARPKEMALPYHLARNGIINEVKSGCKKLALFLHWCKMVVMATVPVKDPGQGREHRHSTSVSPLC